MTEIKQIIVDELDRLNYLVNFVDTNLKLAYKNDDLQAIASYTAQQQCISDELDFLEKLIKAINS